LKKRRLFNDKSLKRIMENLYQDNQLGWDFLRWLLIRTYFQILRYAPAEIYPLFKELLAGTPAGKVIELAELFGSTPVKAGETKDSEVFF
jgi:hypothetical protein